VPVFVDVNIPTYNTKVEEIKAAISQKPRAIFIAHTLGNPFDLSQIMKTVEKYDLYLIEDNCDALGSTYQEKNRHLRTHCDMFILPGLSYRNRQGWGGADFR